MGEINKGDNNIIIRIYLSKYDLKFDSAYFLQTLKIELTENSKIYCYDDGYFISEEFKIVKEIFDEELLNDYSYCLKAIKDFAFYNEDIIGLILDEIPQKNKNSEFYLDAVKADGVVFDFIPNEYRDKYIYLELLKKNGYEDRKITFEEIPNEILDYDIYLEALKQYKISMEKIPKKYKTYDVYLEALKRCKISIDQIPEKYKDYNLYYEFSKCSWTITSKGENLGVMVLDIPKKFRNYDIYFNIVKNSSYSPSKVYLDLCNISKNMIDKKICLEYLKKGGQIERLPADIIDEEICLKYLEYNNFFNLKLIPKKFLTRKFFYKAIKNNGNLIKLESFPKEHLCYQMYIKAAKNGLSAFDNIPQKITDNYNFCLEVIKAGNYYNLLIKGKKKIPSPKFILNIIREISNYKNKTKIIYDNYFILNTKIKYKNYKVLKSYNKEFNELLNICCFINTILKNVVDNLKDVKDEFTENFFYKIFEQNYRDNYEFFDILYSNTFKTILKSLTKNNFYKKNKKIIEKEIKQIEKDFNVYNKDLFDDLNRVFEYLIMLNENKKKDKKIPNIENFFRIENILNLCCLKNKNVLESSDIKKMMNKENKTQCELDENKNIYIIKHRAKEKLNEEKLNYIINKNEKVLLKDYKYYLNISPDTASQIYDLVYGNYIFDDSSINLRRVNFIIKNKNNKLGLFLVEEIITNIDIFLIYLDRYEKMEKNKFQFVSKIPNNNDYLKVSGNIPSFLEEFLEFDKNCKIKISEIQKKLKEYIQKEKFKVPKLSKKIIIDSLLERNEWKNNLSIDNNSLQNYKIKALLMD
jgi:hypothetical protein